MKKLLFILFAFVFVGAKAQTTPSLDEIIKNYSAALGGLDKFNALKTLKMSGTVTAQCMDLPITVLVINKKAMRSDVEVMGQTITNSYNNGKGWKVNPFMGVTS